MYFHFRMTKILWIISRKNYNLNANKGCNTFDFQVNYMFYWRFHFDNETPVNCSITHWKWTYILDFGPWGWSALNMEFVGKWPSRMQERWVFLKSGRRAAVFGWVQKIPVFWTGSCPCPIMTLRKVREGMFNVPRKPRRRDHCICLTKYLQVFHFWHATTWKINYKCMSIVTHNLEFDTYCELRRKKSRVDWHARNSNDTYYYAT